MGVHDCRSETVGRVIQDHQPTVGERHRPEEADFRVGNRLDRAGRDFVPEDVGHSGVIAAAEQVTAVLRKSEALRNGLPEAKFRERRQVAGQDLLQLPHAQELIAADLRHGGRNQSSIRRNVEVVGDDAVRETCGSRNRGRTAAARGPASARPSAWRTPMSARSTGLKTISPIRPCFIRVRFLPRPHVHRHEVPQRIKILVVVGEKNGPGARVVGQRSHLVRHCPLDVGKPSNRAVARIHRADVLDDARVPKPPVQDSGRLVVVRARHGACCRPPQFSMRRNRELPHLGEILLLEFVLELDPVLPGLLERKSEQAQKLVRVIALAALIALVPFDDLLRRIGVRKPRNEARPVQIGVRAGLEIDQDTAGREAQRIVEMGAVPDHRPEHHLVVAALRASQPAAHPGLEEDRAALRPPARGREARRREIAVENRFGILRLRGDIPQKEPTPAPILLGSDVALHHVDQLVIHQRIHALAGGKRLERERQRRNVENQQAARRCIGVGVSVVGEILQQHGRGFRRRPPEHATLPREGIGECTHRVRCEEAQGIVIMEVEILR